jgi:hypothetical protein
VSLATLITSPRTLAADTTTSNLVRAETPFGPNDGANTKFRTMQRNIVTASLYFTANTTYRSQTGVTIDDASNGLFTISSAPAANANPWYIDYNFQWFTDTDYTEFLNDAARDLLAISDPTKVADALVAAMLQYGLGYFYQRRATYFADKYSSSGGQAGQSVDVVTSNFQKLAKAAFDRAQAMRDQYYTRLGSSKAPASATTSYGIDPITPPR